MGGREWLSVGDYSRYDQTRIPLAPLQAALSCPLCRQCFRDPVVVRSCLHHFCRDCIMAVIKEGATACPVCHGTFSGSSDIVEDAGLNQVVSAMHSPAQEKSAVSSASPIEVLAARFRSMNRDAFSEFLMTEFAVQAFVVPDLSCPLKPLSQPHLRFSREITVKQILLYIAGQIDLGGAEADRLVLKTRDKALSPDSTVGGLL